MDKSLYQPVLFVVWAVLVYLSWLAAAGPKLSVLYLRRFRLTSAQAVVTAALEQGLSRRYRIVTLDDASFQPMEVPRLYRRLSRYAGPGLWLALMLVILATIWLLYAQAAPTISGMGSGLALLGMTLFMPGLLVSLTGLLLAVAVALLMQRWRVRRRSRLFVRTRKDIDRVETAVADLSAWAKRAALLAPRATTVKVIDALWQAVVECLAGRTNVILVDLSASTENLQWEMDLLARQSYRRTVFIADRHVESKLAAPPGHDVLLYEDFTEGGDRKAFLAALTRALDEGCIGPGPFDWREWILRPALTCVRTLVLLAAATCVGTYAVASSLVLLARIRGA